MKKSRKRTGALGNHRRTYMFHAYANAQTNAISGPLWWERYLVYIDNISKSLLRTCKEIQESGLVKNKISP